MRIGNWNVRSISGKENVEEMIKQQIKVVEIIEIKTKKKGLVRIQNRYWLIWSGVKGKERVGFIIVPNRPIGIVKEKCVTKDTDNGNKTNKQAVIVAYAEDEDKNAKKEEKDDFQKYT